MNPMIESSMDVALKFGAVVFGAATLMLVRSASKGGAGAK